MILLSSVMVLFVTAAGFGTYEIISFKRQLVRNLSTLAAVIADNSVVPLALDQEDTAADILGALKVEPDIEAGALYDQSGKLFATYPANLGTNRLPTALSPGYRFVNGALVLSVPVIQERKRIGSLYLRCSLRGLYSQFWRYGGIVAAVLAASSVVAFLLSTVLQRRISRPILALTRAAEGVAAREDYSIRAPKLTEDELGTLTDAFNQMLAETQEHQGRLAEQARLLDLSTDAIIVCDLQGTIVYWNRGAEELYGWSRSEAVGQRKFLLLKTEFPQPREDVNAQLLRDNRWSGDLVQTRRDGRRIDVSTRWVMDSGPQGQHSRVLITDNDITLRKQAEALMKSEAQRLEQLVSNRTARLQETIGELEAFSYSISHDMRAPLRAMQGYAKALAADYGTQLDSKANHYLDRIARAAHRLDSLIQDVLAYSRVAKGDMILQPVSLEHLIEDILPAYPEFCPPQARIIIEKPLHIVLGHEASLTQCITNLLGNAVKFVRDGATPEVRIRSELLDGKVRLTVEDNGIGIDAAHLDRIFKIFGQVHSEKKYGGTGIGLAIVRKAAQRMGGEAGVESELGKGSRFWITLLATKDADQSPHLVSGR